MGKSATSYDPKPVTNPSTLTFLFTYTLVTTMVQSQMQITALQRAMQRMADDHMKSQEAMIAWAADCITGLSNQNGELARKLEETNKQVQDMAFNIQGFIDESADVSVPLTEFDQTPPGLYQTITPKVIEDPKEVGQGGNEEEGSSLFSTATGAEVVPGFREATVNARQGGPISLKVPESAAEEMKASSSRKTEEERAEARAMYNTVTPPSFPKDAKGRWKWAYKKVILGGRLQKLKVGMTRSKVQKHETVVARMKRAEVELFYQPIKMKEHVKGETDILNTRIDGEVATLNTELASQKVEYLAMGETLQTNIDGTNVKVEEVRKNLEELKNKVDSGNQALEELEAKANKVTARLMEDEQAIFSSLKGRIQEVSEKCAALKTSSYTTKDHIEGLSKMVEEMSTPETYDESNPALRLENESAKLFKMLEYETEIRNTRGDIGLLDNNTFALGEILKQIRRDVLAMSILAGGDYEAITPKETVNELLAFIDSAHTTLDSIYETVSHANSLWKTHDGILGSKWVVLSGLVDAVKGVSGIAETISALESNVAAKTSVEQATSISLTTVTDALKPVNVKIDENDTKATAGIEDAKTAASAVDDSLKTATDAINSKIANEVDGLMAQMQDMATQVTEAAAAAATASSADGTSAPVAAPTVMSRQSTPKVNFADLEADLEPMIKQIVDAYVANNPSMSRGPGDSIGFFANDAEGMLPPSIDDGSHLFEHEHLEKVFEGDTDANITDEIADDVSVGSHADKLLPIGALVKVILDNHAHTGATGIIVGHTEEGEDGDQPADESKEDAGEALSENQAGSPATLTKTRSKYRVAITPKTPVTGPTSRGVEGVADYGSFESLPLGRPVSKGSLEEVHQQIASMSRKIEDLIGGKVGGGGSQASGLGGGRNSPSMSTGPSVSESTHIVEMIQDSMKAVAAEIGDLRENSHRDIETVKKQMKKALLTAINKAIIEEAEKDKPSMLTTKSMCVGCGRPSLVRGVAFEKDLPSGNAFNPALSRQIAEGPEVYRGGFRMPVTRAQSTGKSVVGIAETSKMMMSEDSIFGESEADGGAALGTYSEILATIDHRDQDATKITDIGPGGMSISITSTTAPIRLSSTARSIRHAQGKEEAAMLRPIHRKGMQGKSSEKARQYANKTWAPERFNSLSLSPTAVSIKIPPLGRGQAFVDKIDDTDIGVDLTQGSLESKFHP